MGNPTSAEGKASSFQLKRSPEEQGWGRWTSYFVSKGPEPLLGRRLIGCERASGPRPFGVSGEFAVQSGDSLDLAPADQAAFLELAMFDQLPEFAGELARIMREGEANMAGIMGPVEMKSAAEFVNSIRNLSENEQVHRRLRRLQESRLARRLASVVATDEEWSELAAAVAPRAEELYSAMRDAMLQQRPVQQMKPKRVSVVSVGLLPVLGLLALLAWGIWQYTKQPSITDVSNDLPLYTLSTPVK